MVERGDLLSELKRVQEGLLDGFERELTTPNTLLITGSGVRVPHHPLTSVSVPEKYFTGSQRLGEYESIGFQKIVEVPGIEPGSFGIKTGLLRA